MTTPLAGIFGLGGPELIVLLLIWLCIGVPLWVAPAVLSYVVLNRIPIEHRKQDSGLAFLLLIPFFSLVWAFFVYPRISESLQSYFAGAGRTDAGDCGKAIALAAAICCACCIIPLLGAFAGLAGLILLIIFFVKAFDLTSRIPRMGVPVGPSLRVS